MAFVLQCLLSQRKRLSDRALEKPSKWSDAIGNPATIAAMDRYSRQRLFPAIGDEGQDRLLESRVALIGCGALGSHIAQHLSRAGVGYLRLCDRDFIELDNLQRQVLYDEQDVAEHLPKAVAARRRLEKINSEVEVDARVIDVTSGNVMSLIEDTHLVLDGTDNFVTRYLLNDACVSTGKPWIYGGCVGSHGMVLTVIPGETPCFTCFLPEMPEPGTTATCDTAGVIGPAVGMVAALQSVEALKILSGHRDALNTGLTTIDLWNNQHRTVTLSRNPGCTVCVKRDFQYLNAAVSDLATRLCGRNAVQITPARDSRVDLPEMERRLSPLGPVLRNEYLLRFTQDGLEMTLFPDGRAVIKGTDEPARARAAYARYIGT